MWRGALVVVLSMVALASASAQSPPADKNGKQPPAQRFSFSPVEGGVLRLDGQTGDVMACRLQNGAWACGAVPEQSAKLQADTAQVQADNTRLKEQIDALERQIAGAGERQASLNVEIEGLKAGNDALKKEVSALNGQIAALRGELTTQGERNIERADITRLSAENNALTETLAALQAETVALRRQLAQLSAAPDKDKAKSESKLLTREDVEYARAVLLDAWRRMVDMVNQLHKDVMGKG